MLKRILAIGALVALTGCATHQQANTAVGAGVGAVVGNAIGGRGGAVVGAVVGSTIGSQQPTRSHSGHYPYSTSVYPDYSMCDHWRYEERQACFRGAEARARQEQSRLNQQAYQRGLRGH